MAYVIQIVRKIKLSVPQLIHTYLFTMLHTISIVNLKLNFDKLTPIIFFNFYYRVVHQYRLYSYLKVYANHFKGVQVMATFNLQCNSLSQIHSSVYFRLKVYSMTGRAYIGEMLIQIWLKSMKK